MLDDEAAEGTELVRREVRGFSERHWVEPEFRERAVAAHVNMRRIVVFVTEEEEPVWAYAKDCRRPFTGGCAIAPVATPLRG